MASYTSALDAAMQGAHAEQLLSSDVLQSSHSPTPQPQPSSQHQQQFPASPVWSIEFSQQADPLDMELDPQHDGPESSSPNDLDMLNETASSLNRLPDDVMLQIFTLLNNPRAFSQTNKHLNLISKDEFFRARWFLNRFPKYDVIFEAIARVKIFTPDLFERLLRGGAVLSRNLAQLLLVLHTPRILTKQSQTSWGASIDTKSFLAVLSEATRLYGNIPLERNCLDSLTFHEYSTLVNYDTSVRKRRLEEMFDTFKFMPLCLRFTDGPSRGSPQVIVERTDRTSLKQALAKEPSLARTACANGYIPSDDDLQWITLKVFLKASKEGFSSSDVATQLQHLQEAGVARVTRSIAMNVVYSLRCGCDTPRHAQSPYLNSYRALLKLHRDGSLDFELQDVFKEITDHWKGGAVDETMEFLLKQAEEDFPTLDISSLAVRMVFMKADKNGHDDIEDIKGQMGRHEVTRNDIWQDSIRNSCTSTASLRYGAEYLAFNLEDFVKELIDAILNQPYRGSILYKLSDLFDEDAEDTWLGGAIDFSTLLAAAVEAQEFSLEQLPAQEWERQKSCNTQPPVRSLLGFGWEYSDTPLWIYDWRSWGPTTDTPTGPFLSQAFTRFGVRSQENSTKSEEVTATRWPNSRVGRREANSLVRFQGLEDALIAMSQPQRVSTSRESERQIAKRRFNNMYGPFDKSAMHVARVVVDILGPSSRSANVLMAHAFLDGNTGLITHLLKIAHVPLTLYHIMIGMKVGYPLPSSLLEHLQNGAPFKASFDAAEDEPDADLLAQKKGGKAVLTQEEKAACEAIAASRSLGTTIYVDVDATGAVDVSSAPRGRAGIVKQIQALEPFESSHTTPAPQQGATDLAAPTLQDVEMTEAAGSSALPATIEVSGAPVDEADKEPAAAIETQGTTRQTRSSLAAASGTVASEESHQDNESSNEEELEQKHEGDWIININSMPVIVSKAELDRRIRSLELWQSHLNILRYNEDRKHVALKACNQSGRATKRSEAHKYLADVVLKGLREAAKSLYEALPAADKKSALLIELKELWVDMEQHDDRAHEIKHRVDDMLRVKKHRKQVAERRNAFNLSRYSSSVKLSEETKSLMKPLSDEESDDEDFEAPLTAGDSDSDDESDKSSVEVDSSSDEEPAPKRFKSRRHESAVRHVKPSSSKLTTKARSKELSATQKAAPKSRVIDMSDLAELNEQHNEKPAE